MLFYRVGGDSRVASFMLAGANLVVLFIGPSIIGYLPGMNPYIFFSGDEIRALTTVISTLCSHGCRGVDLHPGH